MNNIWVDSCFFFIFSIAEKWNDQNFKNFLDYDRNLKICCQINVNAQVHNSSSSPIFFFIADPIIPGIEKVDKMKKKFGMQISSFACDDIFSTRST